MGEYMPCNLLIDDDSVLFFKWKRESARQVEQVLKKAHCRLVAAQNFVQPGGKRHKSTSELVQMPTEIRTTMKRG